MGDNFETYIDKIYEIHGNIWNQVNRKLYSAEDFIQIRFEVYRNKKSNKTNYLHSYKKYAEDNIIIIKLVQKHKNQLFTIFYKASEDLFELNKDYIIEDNIIIFPLTNEYNGSQTLKSYQLTAFKS
jgi:hypothetical protein